MYICKKHGLLKKINYATYIRHKGTKSYIYKRCLLCKKLSDQKFINTGNAAILHKKNHHRRLSNLPDYYIKYLLIKNSKQKLIYIPKELIDTKRELLQLKRLIKEKLKQLV